jgi:hypothetical protein
MTKVRLFAIAAALIGGIGAVAIPATAAYAVNTSYINYYTIPPSDQPIYCVYNTGYSIDHPTNILDVYNKCSVRIFLHEDANGSGYNVCINPGQDKPIGRTVYRQLQVTANHNNCT